MTESHSAVRDELLGSPNRRPMQEAIDGAMEHLRAGGEPTAVLLVEVGGLADAGEALLAALAERLTASLRPQDLVARFGARRHRRRRPRRRRRGRRARARGAASSARSRSLTGVGASVGVSLLRESRLHRVGAVIGRADAAMYAAKNKRSREARGDRDCPPESSREDARRGRVRALDDRGLRRLLPADRRPAQRLGRRGRGAAALGASGPRDDPAGRVPRRGGAAGADGHARPLGDRQGVRADGALAGDAQRAADAHVASTSRRRRSPSRRSPRTCCRALARHGATGQQLALELTQATLDAAPPGAARHARRGAHRARRSTASARASPPPSSSRGLDVAMIKLDRCWTQSSARRRADGDAARRRRARARLGVPAVAQGIETRDQLAMARECGYVLAQGHLFSRPQSGPAVEQLVYRERPFASLLAPRPAWLDLADRRRRAGDRARHARRAVGALRGARARRRRRTARRATPAAARSTACRRHRPASCRRGRRSAAPRRRDRRVRCTHVSTISR